MPRHWGPSKQRLARIWRKDGRGKVHAYKVALKSNGKVPVSKGYMTYCGRRVYASRYDFERGTRPVTCKRCQQRMARMGRC